MIILQLRRNTSLRGDSTINYIPQRFQPGKQFSPDQFTALSCQSHAFIMSRLSQTQDIIF